MKLQLITLATVALLGGAAWAQPGGHGHGPGGFGLLELDTNADGKLTRAEFDAAQRARFNQIDANKDGSATSEEFKAFRDAEMQKRRAEMAKIRFDRLDTDKNGQLSQTELAARPDGDDDHGRGRGGRHDGHGRGGPGKADGHRADADKNSKVTLAEFSARGLEAFNRADANKDGTVTVAELQAMRPDRP